MGHYETSESEPSVPDKQSRMARWWTRKRLQRVGLAGFIGCTIFALLVIGWNAYSVITGKGLDSWTFTVMIVEFIHAAGYTLMFLVLIATSARFTIGFGRFGRAAVAVLAALLAWAALDMVIWWISPRSLPIGPGDMGLVYFLGIHLFLATIVGIVLWYTPGVSRLAAGLFLIVTPMFVIPAILMEFGFPDPTAAAFEVPLIQGIAVLGYQLWTGSEAENATTTTEVANA